MSLPFSCSISASLFWWLSSGQKGDKSKQLSAIAPLSLSLFFFSYLITPLSFPLEESSENRRTNRQIMSSRRASFSYGQMREREIPSFDRLFENEDAPSGRVPIATRMKRALQNEKNGTSSLHSYVISMEKRGKKRMATRQNLQKALSI